MSRVLRIFLVWISLLTISSCLVSPPYVVSQNSWTPDYWPTDGWRVSTPEAQHMSSSHLFAMRNFLYTHPYQVDSVLVIRNGYIVYEDYPTGHTVTMRHTLYSVTKSVTSAVMGIALGQGFFNGTQDRLLDFFPNRTIANLDQRKKAITVENLLTMKAGFEWDEWSIS